jgi:hypothetical protein
LKDAVFNVPGEGIFGFKLASKKGMTKAAERSIRDHEEKMEQVK